MRAVTSPTTRLMTIAQFDELSETSQGFRYELRHGEPVKVPPPKHDHFSAQRRLRRLLERAVGETGEVEIELAFRPLPEYEFWRADVGFVSRERWQRISPKGNLEGAPELVVEVLSPSNTAAEMLDRRNVCLENGSREFWLVDLAHRQAGAADSAVFLAWSNVGCRRNFSVIPRKT